jgi:hypothetical protein
MALRGRFITIKQPGSLLIGLFKLLTENKYLNELTLKLKLVSVFKTEITNKAKSETLLH